MFVVVTKAGGTHCGGTMVNKGSAGVGIPEKVAQTDAQERNARAEKMGLKVRYEAVER